MYLYITTCVVLSLLTAQPVDVDSTKTQSVDAKSSATWKRQDTDSLPPAGASWAVIGKLDGIQGKVVKYNQKLFRGGPIESDEGARQLKKLGVTAIVSVTPTRKERSIASRNDLQLVEVPFGNDKPVPQELVDFFVQTVKRNEGAVYVHCSPPGNRSRVLAAQYRVEAQGWSCERAILEFKDVGGDAGKSAEMLKSLQGK